MNQHHDPKRRGFIAAATATPVAMAAAAVQLPVPASPGASPRAEGSGYRATEHIHRYYKTLQT